jgi:cell division protein FtsL
MVLLKGLAFYLHPAALGKTRKSIFERQIVCKGGRLVTDIQSSEMGANKELVVLVEDSLTDSSKLVSIASKLRASPGIPSGIAVVGLSWLSKCLEKDQLVSRHPFEIAPSVARADQGRSSAAEKVSAPNTAPLVSEPVVSPAPSTSNEDSRQIFIERNKHKFVCAQSSETPRVAIDHPNKAVTDQLERLAAVYKASNDTWRAFSYQKAASAIKNYGQKITSRDEAVAIRGVGQKMADKVMEIIEEGTLQKADELCDSEKVTCFRTSHVLVAIM